MRGGNTDDAATQPSTSPSLLDADKEEAARVALHVIPSLPVYNHDGTVYAVAAGALPDGTPVIIGGSGRMVQVWRLADGTPVGEPLHLPESVRGVTVHGNLIITAAGANIAVHQPALPRPMS